MSGYGSYIYARPFGSFPAQLHIGPEEVADLAVNDLVTKWATDTFH